MLSGKQLTSRVGVKLVPVLLLVVCLICIALISFRQFHQQLNSTQQHLTQSAQHDARNMVALVEQPLTQWQQRLASVSASERVRTAMQAGDQTQINVEQQELKVVFPEAEKICLLPGEVSEPQAGGCLPITFATLNSLQLVYAHKLAPAAVIQAGTANAHILLAKDIRDKQGQLLGAILIAVNPAVIDNLLKKDDFFGGYSELYQGSKKTFVLSRGGEDKLKQGQPMAELPVSGSYWHLAYWEKQPSAYTPALTTLGLILLLVVVFWTLRELWMAYLQKQDVAVLKQQIHDLASGKMKPEYHLKLAVLDDITLEIHNLVIPSKGQRSKPPSPPSVDTLPELIVEPVKDSEKQQETTPVEVPPEIFKAYDIRGLVEQQLNPDVMRLLGQAIASEALDQQQTQIAVARDGRISSEQYCQALIEGILMTGCNVTDIGEVPTPLLYFACEHLGISSSVMVTGSHNPVDYNGLKVVIAGKSLAGQAIKALYERIQQGQWRTGQGQLNFADVIAEYSAKVAENISLARSIKVVMDCGNGVTGHLVPALFESLGCEVIPLYNEVDGRFPNHHPDPAKPENLQDLSLAVQQYEAELGIAFDGDGDRIGVVDAGGHVIWPDRLLVLLAQDLLAREPGAKIIYDVKSTSLLTDAILRAGGEAVMSPSGHSLIRNQMAETNALLAGEMSGHIFFKDRWYGFDDALYAAARLLEFVSVDPLERTLTEIFAALPKRIETPEILIEMDAADCRDFIVRLVNEGDFNGGHISTIDGIRVEYPHGWGLVRASNTVPALTLRFEASDVTTLNQIKQIFVQQMLRIKPSLTLTL